MKTSLAVGLVAVLLAGIAGRAAGDTPPPSPAPPASGDAAEKKDESKRPYEPPPKLANIRVDLTLTDRRPNEPPVVKTATMTLSNSRGGALRAGTQVPGVAYYQLNIDARPVIEPGDVIRVDLTVEYQPQPSDASAKQGFQLKQSASTLFTNGKPLVVAEASDPVTDRRVTLEVKATILR